MRRYSEEFIKQARDLRAKGKLSLKELGRRINVPDTTLGGWFHGTIGNRWDSLIVNNERKRKEIKNSELSAVRNIESLTKAEAKFFAGLLYGCEGSRYPAHRGVAFANSDPQLIAAFLELFRKGFELDESKFAVHLQIHTTQDYEKLRKYWSNLLSLPEKCFSKPTIKAPRGGKHREVYMGTCTLRYWDYRIQLKLLGIFERFIKSAVFEDNIAV